MNFTPIHLHSITFMSIHLCQLIRTQSLSWQLICTQWISRQLIYRQTRLCQLTCTPSISQPHLHLQNGIVFTWTRSSQTLVPLTWTSWKDWTVRDNGLTFKEAGLQVNGQKLVGPLSKPLKCDRPTGDVIPHCVKSLRKAESLNNLQISFPMTLRMWGNPFLTTPFASSVLLIFVLLSMWKKRPLFCIAGRFLFCQPCVLLTKKKSTLTSRDMCTFTGTKFGQRIAWIFVMAIVYALIGEIKLVSTKWLWTTCWIEWAGFRFAFGTCGTQMRRKQLWIKLHAGKGYKFVRDQGPRPNNCNQFMEWTEGKYIFQVRSLKGVTEVEKTLRPSSLGRLPWKALWHGSRMTCWSRCYRLCDSTESHG